MRIRYRDLFRRIKDEEHPVKRGRGARRQPYRMFWRKHPARPGVPRQQRRKEAKALWKALGKRRTRQVTS